ncbi:hypothetical protein NA78x_005670 [Anatilimnocola sp. NA78]|uniref:hypothetical protein n=1 Tax=Anatilimnocola sp. NA78 TaxID=3415683 RepID=UPI003CE4D9EF
MANPASPSNYLLAGGFAIVTALFWGAYGPILHKGVVNMGPIAEGMGPGRLRPFLCVGIAYFLISIIGPILVMQFTGMEKGAGFMRGWTINGTVLSIAGGAAGALGAFALIMALNYGGPTGPFYVMPMVFGCAPVVSTLVSAYVLMNIDKKQVEISPYFLVGLVIVAVGAVTTLINAPRPAAAAKPGAEKVAPATTPKADLEKSK